MTNKNRPIKPHSSYTFPISMIWFQLGMVYFWAGFDKLWDSGFEWALGPSMLNQIWLEWFEHYGRIPEIRIDKLPWFTHLSGLLVITFEIAFLWMLFHRYLRYVSIIGGLVMHKVIDYFMYHPFGVVQAHYLAFVDINSILRWFANQKNRYRTWFFDVRHTDANYTMVGRKMLSVCLLVVGLNFIFSVFDINTYPFSPFPSYSSITDRVHRYLYYDIQDKKFKDRELFELAERKGFRWENFSKEQAPIIKKYRQKGFVDTTHIYKQWQWWRSEIPQLMQADTVDVYLNTISLKPDSFNNPYKKKFLVTLYPNKRAKDINPIE